MSKMWNCIICYTNEWGIYVSTVITFSGILASSLFNACRVYLSIVLIKYGLSERWKNTSQIVEIISGHKTFRGNSMEHDNVNWKHWNWQTRLLKLLLHCFRLSSPYQYQWVQTQVLAVICFDFHERSSHRDIHSEGIYTEPSCRNELEWSQDSNSTPSHLPHGYLANMHNIRSVHQYMTLFTLLCPAPK